MCPSRCRASGRLEGALALLTIVFVLPSFLDSIAAALIGGTVAYLVFKGKVHTGCLAAIVAASNAGGSGSVVGDTTTTMMRIDGVSPLPCGPPFLSRHRFDAPIGRCCRKPSRVLSSCWPW